MKTILIPQCTLSHTVLFQNKKYSIEVYKNDKSNKNRIVLVKDQLYTDWPLKTYDGSVLYDHPEKYPKYIKKLVAKFYSNISLIENNVLNSSL
jgi:hypothetical protein